MKDKGVPGTRMIQSIERGARVLELFLDDPEPLGIADIARTMSLPKTTVQGIVNTLAHLRYLERDGRSPKYRLGAKLFQLGLVYAANMDIISLARVWMERLCFQFRIAVNVGMLVGSRVIIVLRVEPENRFMAFPQAGTVIPSHTTAIGKMIFAHMDDERRDEILRGYPFERLTENTITNTDEFLKDLDRVRREGVSFDSEENFIGLVGIGGPIYDNTGQVIAAFAVAGDAGRIRASFDEIISAVKYTSSEVSALLGYEMGRL